MSESSPVFVIDDEESVRESLGRLVRVIGFSSRTYASAESFLESYDANEGDANEGGCVLVDLRMPGMSGADLIEELERRQSGLPIIVMSGHTDLASVRRARRPRMIGFLEKPFSVEQLRELLDRWRSSTASGS